MEPSNGLAFLPLLAVLGLLGLKISWSPIRVGETDSAANVGIWQLALDLVSEEEASLGVARSLFVPITFQVVRKMLALSFTFACWRDILRGLKLSCTTSTSTVTSGVMVRTTDWMVGLMNCFCVEILFVVSVVEIPLVVGGATFGLLFGSLPSTLFFRNHLE